MGAATDAGNATRGISREEQDEVAARSHQRADTARAAGIFDAEIALLTIPRRKGPALTVSADEGIRTDTTAQSLSALRPAFSTAENATITAGSASPISDGAAGVVIASKAMAEAAGLTWIAKICAHGQTAGPDGSLHSQPSRAIEAALKREGLTVDDLDLIEINEAFTSVVIQSANDLESTRTGSTRMAVPSPSDIRSVPPAPGSCSTRHLPFSAPEAGPAWSPSAAAADRAKR